MLTLFLNQNLQPLQQQVRGQTSTVETLILVALSSIRMNVFCAIIIIAISTATTTMEVPVPTSSTSLHPHAGWKGPKVSSDPNDVRFYLYGNPENDESHEELLLHNVNSLMNSDYNQSRPLILLIHGVLSTYLTNSDVQLVKNAYLRANCEANLVMVDYGPLTVSRLPLLLSPASFFVLLMGHGNTRVVASQVEQFILFLMSYHMLSGPEDVHIIGFSLGSHVAGNVGRRISRSTGTKIARITALDPSPQFKTQHRLAPADANFVDVTLTSLGYMSKIRTQGHVQFWMNGGGPHQPNCPFFLPVTETYCSHITAPFYYAKSILRKTPVCGCACTPMSCHVEVTNCSEPVVYGEFTPLTARGNYYVKIE